MLGNLILVSAASGTGKTSLVRRLVQEIDNLVVSISYTTRAQRDQEVQGESYFFVSSREFQVMQEQGDFVETADIFGCSYGTPKRWLLEKLQQGIDIICEVDWQGAQAMIKQFIDAVSIFILPPSLEALKKRLHERGREDQLHIAKRLGEAGSDMRHYKEYQYLVVNDSFDKAVEKLKTIIMAQRLLTIRQGEAQQALLEHLLHDKES